MSYTRIDFSSDGALQDLIAEWRGRSAGATIATVLNTHCVAAKPGVAGTVSLLIFGEPHGRFECKAATHVIELSKSAIAEWMARYPQEAAPLTEIRAALAPLIEVLDVPATHKKD